MASMTADAAILLLLRFSPIDIPAKDEAGGYLTGRAWLSTFGFWVRSVVESIQAEFCGSMSSRRKTPCDECPHFRPIAKTFIDEL
jgi:hypothetical protein